MLLSGLVLFSLFFCSCDAINPDSQGELTDYSCEGCHTNKAALDRIINDLNLDPPVEEHAAPG